MSGVRLIPVQLSFQNSFPLTPFYFLPPARPHDFFDAQTMDAIRHRAICLNLATHIESQGKGHSVVFHSTVGTHTSSPSHPCITSMPLILFLLYIECTQCTLHSALIFLYCILNIDSHAIYGYSSILLCMQLAWYFDIFGRMGRISKCQISSNKFWGWKKIHLYKFKCRNLYKFPKISSFP